MRESSNNLAKIVFVSHNNNHFSYRTHDFDIVINAGFYVTESDIERKCIQKVSHCHNNYEMHMIMSGSCTFRLCDNTDAVISEGDFILIPPGYKHMVVCESKGFSKNTFSFSFDPLGNDDSFYRRAVYAAKTPKVCKSGKSMLCSSEAIIENNEKRPPDYMTTIFFNYLLIAIDAFRTILGNAAKQPQKNSADFRVTEAINYIKKNISALLGVSEVADYMHMSQKQLTRIFKKSINITPGNYIRNCRSGCIENILSLTDMQIDDIAEIMGYSDKQNLIKAYKRASGFTPQRYRKIRNEKH